MTIWRQNSHKTIETADCQLIRFIGTAKSKDCTLIITEGDSAKSLAMSGLSVVGRDFYGVFPLRGKPLNVRDATHSQVIKNEEIKNIIDILGLKPGVEYDETNIKTLRKF